MKSHFAPAYYYAVIALCILSLVLITLLTFGQSSQGPRNGSSAINSVIVGSTSTWSNMTNALTVNAVFANNTSDLTVTDQYTDYLLISNFGFTIPPSGVILGIQVRVTRLETNSKVLDYRLRLVKGGSIGTTDRISGAVWPSINTTRVYGGTSDLWGNTWTNTDINSSAFGVALAIKRAAGGVAPINAQVDNIRITIYYNTSLPVELLSYTAAVADNVVTLHWQTATEINNNYFTIARSNDGITYNAIAQLNGSGNTSGIRNYSFNDDVTNAPSPGGTFYYRLSQTDFDDTTKEIGLRTVTVNKTENIFSVYPNPFINTINVCLDDVAMPASISINNVSGRIVYSETISSVARGAEHIINLTGKIEPGVYFVSVTTADKKTVQRIIK